MPGYVCLPKFAYTLQQRAHRHSFELLQQRQQRSQMVHLSLKKETAQWWHISIQTAARRIMELSHP